MITGLRNDHTNAQRIVHIHRAFFTLCSCSVAPRLYDGYPAVMAKLSVYLEGGRMWLDDPAGGEPLALVVDDGGDDLDDAERAELAAMLDASAKASQEGRVRPAAALVAELLARHAR